MALTQPTLIPQPWASNGQVGNIPQDSSEFGKASWAKGFPTETAQPLSEGGIPPSYLDFQGVLNALSNHAFFQQSGAKYTWSNTLQYPAKAVILGSDGNVYEAIVASGPGSTVGAVNPVTDTTRAAWQPYTALPEQTGNEAGFVLATNGTDAEWYDIKSDTVEAVEQASEGFDGEAGDSPTTAQLATELLTKAGTDLANLNAAGREVAAGASMPSNRYVDLTLGANGTNYTAPADGWFTLSMDGVANNYAMLRTSSNSMRTVGASPPNGTTWAGTFIPVKKGDTVGVNYYSAGAIATVFRFIYAEGAE